MKLFANLGNYDRPTDQDGQAHREVSIQIRESENLALYQEKKFEMKQLLYSILNLYITRIVSRCLNKQHFQTFD